MMKTGLVLEGGAMRGMFTAGVMDVLMEEGITFDGVIGVSAGACFGCNYKSHQIGRVIRYSKRFAKEPKYCSFRSLLKTGDLYGAEFCYHTVPEKLDPFDNNAFLSNPSAFYVVCTNAKTGEPVYHEIVNADAESLEWIRASASMPIVSRPVEIAKEKYLDGGISDSIPLSWFQKQGYTKNVIVLTQPEDYVKKPMAMMGLMKIALRKYPKIIERLENRHCAYNKETELVKELEKRGEVFVIRPKEKLPIGKIEHDPSKMEIVYQMGRDEAERQLEALIAFRNV